MPRASSSFEPDDFLNLGLRDDATLVDTRHTSRLPEPRRAIFRIHVNPWSTITQAKLERHERREHNEPRASNLADCEEGQRDFRDVG